MARFFASFGSTHDQVPISARSMAPRSGGPSGSVDW